MSLILMLHKIRGYDSGTLALDHVLGCSNHLASPASLRWWYWCDAPYSTPCACCAVVDSCTHYCDVIMGAIASQITSLTIVYSTVYSDADQSKHQSFASLAFVRGIHRGPVNSPHKWPVTRKMFPFDDVIIQIYLWSPLTSETLARCHETSDPNGLPK